MSRQREHSDYRRRLAKGRTIGIGMTEGGCKRIIGRRLNRTATLCGGLHADEWKTYWNISG